MGTRAGGTPELCGHIAKNRRGGTSDLAAGDTPAQTGLPTSLRNLKMARPIPPGLVGHRSPRHEARDFMNTTIIKPGFSPKPAQRRVRLQPVWTSSISPEPATASPKPPEDLRVRLKETQLGGY